MRASRPAILLSALPSLLMLGLFYSLALHMHRSLGGWPAGIGELGFSGSLVTHATIADNVFVFVFLGMFFLPVPILVCLLVERWRHLVFYFAVYAGLFLTCWALMQLAPAQFLYWWRD